MDINLLLTGSDEQSVNLSSSWNFESPNTSEIPQLPSDIIYQILLNFKYCRSSLKKFLQINRIWCHISLIFLWNCPFDVSLKARSSVLLIRTLLSFLSDQEKSELKLNLSCHELNSKNSVIYNYPEYIRVFDLKHFRLSVLHWISYLRYHKNEDFFSDSLIIELNKIYNDNVPVNYSTVNLASGIINNMLFRKCGDNGLQHLIIENDDIVSSNYVISKNIIYLNNALSQLENFEFNYKIERNDKNLLIDRIVEMFENMKEFVKNLKWLDVNIENEEGQIPKIGKALVEFIEEQKHLEVLGINEFWMYEENEIYKRICGSQQSSLKHVRIYEMRNFKELIKGLSECMNLVTLEFLRLSKYDSNVVFLKDELEGKELSIKNFYTCEETSFDAPEITNYFIQIIKMSNKNLKTLTLTHITRDIIEALVRFCPNITHLSLFFTFQHFNLIPDLLSALLPPLSLEQFFLKIDDKNSESTIYTQDYWNTIAKSIPDSIIHLGIDFKIEKNMLDMFLKECKAQLRTISLFQGYMLNRYYLQIIVQYARKNKLLKELRFLWDPNESGFISNSNLEDARKVIKVINKVEPFNKPFYDTKITIPLKKDQLFTSFSFCEKV